MRKPIAEEACRGALHKMSRLHAIEASKTCSELEQNRHFFTHVVCKGAGLPGVASPKTNRFGFDQQNACNVSASSWGGDRFNRDSGFRLTSFEKSSIFLLRKCDLSTSSVFESSACSCPSPPVVQLPAETSHSQRTFLETRRYHTASPKTSASAVERTSRRTLPKNTPSGYLTCRERGRHSRAQPGIHLLQRVRGYKCPERSPLPACDEDAGTPDRRMRHWIHIVRRTHACPAPLSQLSSSPPQAAGGAARGRHKNTQQLVSDGASPAEVAVEAPPPKINEQSPLRPATSPHREGVTGCSGTNTRPLRSRALAVGCVIEAVPIKKSLSGATACLPTETAAPRSRRNGGGASFETKSSTPRSQGASPPVQQDSACTDCRHSNSTTGHPDEPLATVDNCEECNPASPPLSGRSRPLEQLAPLSASRLEPVNHTQCSTLSPPTVRPASRFTGEEATLKAPSRPTVLCDLPQNAFPAVGGPKTDLRDEQSSGRCVSPISPVHAILKGFASRTEERRVALADPSAPQPQQSNQACTTEHCPVQQAETSKFKEASHAQQQLQQQRLALREEAHAAEDDRQSKNEAPQRSGSRITTQPQGEPPRTGALQEKACSGEACFSEGDLRSSPRSLLTQESNPSRRLLMPPPSPPRFLLPPRYRVPLQPDSQLSRDDELLSLDEEERTACPGMEFATTESTTRHSQTGYSREEPRQELALSACIGSNTPVVCRTKRLGPDGRSSSTETASGNFGVATSSAAGSRGENDGNAFHEVVSALQSTTDKTSGTTSTLLGGLADSKASTCLSAQTSFTDGTSVTPLRMPQPERLCQAHPGQGFAEMDEGDNSRVRHEKAASGVRHGEAATSWADAEPHSRQPSAARNVAAAAKPLHCVVVQVPRRLGGAHPCVKAAQSTSDRRRTLSSTFGLPARREGAGQQPFMLSSVPRPATDPPFPRAGTGTGRAISESKTRPRVDIFRLLQHTSRPPRTRLIEKRLLPHGGRRSSFCSAAREASIETRPAQGTRYFEAHSLPASPLTALGGTARQKRSAPPAAEHNKDMATCTSLRSAFSSEKAVCSRRSEKTLYSKVQGGGQEPLSDRRCDASEAQVSQRVWDASCVPGRWRTCSVTGPLPCTAASGNCTCAGPYSVTAPSCQYAPPQARLAAALIELPCSDRVPHLGVHASASSSRSHAQIAYGLHSSDSPVCPCPPLAVATGERPPSGVLPAPTAAPEGSAVTRPHSIKRVFQAAQEKDDSNDDCAAHLQPATASATGATVLGDGAPTVFAGKHIEQHRCRQVSGTACAGSRSPTLVVSSPCHALQPTAKQKGATQPREPRVHRPDSRSIREDAPAVAHSTVSNETPPASVATTDEMFTIKTARRKLKSKHERQAHNHVHIRISLGKAFRERLTAAAQAASLPAPVGRPKVAAPDSQRSASSEEQTSSAGGERREESTSKPLRRMRCKTTSGNGDESARLEACDVNSAAQNSSGATTFSAAPTPIATDATGSRKQRYLRKEEDPSHDTDGTLSPTAQRVSLVTPPTAEAPARCVRQHRSVYTKQQTTSTLELTCQRHRSRCARRTVAERGSARVRRPIACDSYPHAGAPYSPAHCSRPETPASAGVPYLADNTRVFLCGDANVMATPRFHVHPKCAEAPQAYTITHDKQDTDVSQRRESYAEATKGSTLRGQLSTSSPLGCHGRPRARVEAALRSCTSGEQALLRTDSQGVWYRGVERDISEDAQSHCNTVPHTACNLRRVGDGTWSLSESLERRREDAHHRDRDVSASVRASRRTDGAAWQLLISDGGSNPSLFAPDHVKSLAPPVETRFQETGREDAASGPEGTLLFEGAPSNSPDEPRGPPEGISEPDESSRVGCESRTLRGGSGKTPRISSHGPAGASESGPVEVGTADARCSGDRRRRGELPLLESPPARRSKMRTRSGRAGRQDSLNPLQTPDVNSAERVLRAHRTGSPGPVMDAGYHADLQRQSTPGSAPHVSNRFVADPTRNAMSHRTSQCSAQTEEERLKPPPEELLSHSSDSFQERGPNSNNRRPAQRDPPDIHCNLSPSALAQRLFLRDKRGQPGTKNRAAEFTRPSLSKMDLLLERIVSFKRVLEQNGSFSIPEAVAA